MWFLSLFRSPGISFTLLFCCLLFVPWGLTLAQSSCEIAEEHYREGNYDEAIRVAQDLLKDPGTKLKSRICAYRVLRMSYCAKSKQYLESVEATMRDMVGLDLGRILDPEDKCPQSCLDLLYKLQGECKTTLAILPFAIRCPPDDSARLHHLIWGLADRIMADLTLLTDLILVEQEKIKEILKRMKLEAGAEFDQETVSELGRLLGAQSVSLGSFTCLPNGEMQTCTRLVKTETAEIFCAECAQEKVDDPTELIPALSNKIAECVGQ